jgi:SAM-dependent methyltransferase
MDYSYAVDANYASNGSKPNVLIVQGDIYQMPFKEGIFDRAFALGMLQHTPRVREAFLSLPRYLRHGGSLVVDVYSKPIGLRKLAMTRYWIRPITRRIAPEKLYRLCKKYVSIMWPLASVISRLPRIGRHLNWMLFIADYRGKYQLSEELLKEWAILDTFDMLSPAYDSPQAIETVRSWFAEAALENVEVKYGYNGIEGRGARPLETPQLRSASLARR